MKCKNKLCDFDACDLLGLSTILTKEIINIVKDTDTLSMVGDLVTAVGANLTLAAGQRGRCEKPD
ncbi:MAG: hypothetical protein LBG88_00370 [Christensenellaceae bacterium]|nr:hypothetical protein [Christensenellaceae bacterium]